MVAEEVLAQCREQFRQCQTEEEAKAFVRGLSLTVAGLKELSRGMGVSPMDRTRDALILRLVAHTVGSRLAREAIWKGTQRR